VGGGERGMSKRSPLAVRLPLKRGPYQEAVPRWNSRGTSPFSNSGRGSSESGTGTSSVGASGARALGEGAAAGRGLVAAVPAPCGVVGAVVQADNKASPAMAAAIKANRITPCRMGARAQARFSRLMSSVVAAAWFIV
jgi:hypothetical protein